MTKPGKIFLILLVFVVSGILIGCAGSETDSQTSGGIREDPGGDAALESVDGEKAEKDEKPITVPTDLPPEPERESLDEIQVRIDGVLLETDVPPEFFNGRALVPMRALFEALGASVEWDGATGTVNATRGELGVRLTIDSKEAFVDGIRVELDTPPRLLNGRTFVPLRFVSEALGFQMSWDLRVIEITSKP